MSKVDQSLFNQSLFQVFAVLEKTTEPPVFEYDYEIIESADCYDSDEE